jgi:3-oxoadipate enol-lactonase
MLTVLLAAIAFVSGPAGKLRVDDGGSGPGAPVLFVHGLGGDIGTWRYQLEHVRKTRRAIAMELRGHGESDPPANHDWSMAALADDVAAVADALKLQRFVLVGHSMSGTVLQIYAAKHPERLAGLVFVDAVASFAMFPQATVDKAIAEDEKIGLDRGKQRATFADMLGDKAKPATRQIVLESLAHLPPEAFTAVRKEIFHFAPPGKLDGLRVLSIEAKLPKPMPISVSQVFPGVRVAYVDNVSHWLMLDAPAEFNRLLDDFLR